ncbi:hypothetical protein SKAU_G00318680 [Synaphobranchus kaupii]|uniref:Uncharacterized protein n=1 Tax=Synaphobranchus kaupii TaxID=118154 RepID=A0A9Q1ET73_SYNKA|nr:hypothetical protein SKAU_G00318680 [Synaphobranchus kaupii]
MQEQHIKAISGALPLPSLSREESVRKARREPGAGGRMVARAQSEHWLLAAPSSRPCRKQGDSVRLLGSSQDMLSSSWLTNRASERSYTTAGRARCLQPGEELRSPRLVHREPAGE